MVVQPGSVSLDHRRGLGLMNKVAAATITANQVQPVLVSAGGDND
jgi:hypothetical protein